jgi:hypothetical protein
MSESLPLTNPSVTSSNQILFPRIAIWGVDTYTQPLAKIARYDLVVLGTSNEPNLGALKLLNSHLKVINSTNASVVTFNPAQDAPVSDNSLARSIPPEWFLTQVGTTVRSPVNATTTQIPVSAVEVSGGGNTYQLFVANDTALIEGESVYIESVDKINRVLTVRRGYVRPASAHAAGVRIAALITTWPNSWMLNLSTLSPKVTVDPKYGPETWAEYNARIGISFLANPLWDGIILDNSDPDISGRIGISTARTIDPDQSNHLLTDYKAFDTAWNTGLRNYMTLIRTAIGPQKIMFSNQGMANYDLLNGSNFEGFPKDPGIKTTSIWEQAVFGSQTNRGGYFDWISQAQQPNLTTIMTFDDDTLPENNGNSGYTNPCVQPGFKPDYRKMRFGLTTALLNDGYFTYEMNTDGLGSLCLMWFDEYDNAGAGRGYLGQPIGAAYRTNNMLSTPDLLPGGSFDSRSDLSMWKFWAASGYSGNVSLDSSTSALGTASAHVQVAQASGTDCCISFFSAPFKVQAAQDYTLTFWARADRSRLLYLHAVQNSDPWQEAVDFGSLSLSDQWQKYELTAASALNDSFVILIFGLGDSTGSIWLDDVTLQQGNLAVWRRDYTRGTVLVNAGNTQQTIDLGGQFFKIKGTQDPTVNDGSLVSQVTLPPYDGIILLREKLQNIFLPIVNR